MLKNVIIFTAGVVVGGVTAYYITKKKCDTQRIKEIAETRNHYLEKELEKKKLEGKQLEMAVNAIIESSNGEEALVHDPDDVQYTLDQYLELKEQYASPAVEDPDICVMDAECLGNTGNPIVEAAYYADDVLADMDTEELIPIDDVGRENLNSFADDDTDVVYIRNNVKGIDYAVTKDPRTFEYTTGIHIPTDGEMNDHDS